MSNYEQLKADIAAVVRANGIEAITGDRLQQVLTHMVDVLGNDYALAGVATPTTNPPTPDGNTAYIAGTSGTYTYFLDSNYNPLVVPSNCLTALLVYDASAEAWTAYPFGTIAQGTIGTNELADGAVTTPKIADSAVTSAKIGANAVTSAKINNGAVSEQKLATALQNKINDAVTLSTGQTITGDKEFTRPIQALELYGDGDLSVHALDDLTLQSHNGDVEIAADDDINLNGARVFVNSGLIVDAGLEVGTDTGGVNSIKATGKILTNGQEVATKAYTDAELATKQDTIADLSTIRAGAALGATAYQKPSGGIPESDLSASVQTSLGKADTALQGIPDGAVTTPKIADEAVTIAKIAPSAIDATPTANSGNLVTSGAVFAADEVVSRELGKRTLNPSGTGGYIKLAYSVGDTVPLNVVSSSAWRYYIISCSAGDVFLLNGTGGTNPRLWGFLDATDKLLSVADAAVTATDLLMTAPTNAAKLIINDNSNATSYKIEARSTAEKVYIGTPNAIASLKNNLRDKFGIGRYNYADDVVKNAAIDTNGTSINFTGRGYAVFPVKGENSVPIVSDAVAVSVAYYTGTPDVVTGSNFITRYTTGYSGRYANDIIAPPTAQFVIYTFNLIPTFLFRSIDRKGYCSKDIHTKKKGFGFEYSFTMTNNYNGNSLQAAASYGGVLFQTYDKGYCRTYDLTTGTRLAYFNMNSSEISSLHCGTANFGVDFFAGNTSFPALYVSGDLVNWRCYVYNVQKTSCSLAQTITFNLSAYKYGSGSSVNIDKERKRIVYIQRNLADYSDPSNEFKVVEFNIPDITQSSITLTDADVLASYTLPYYVINYQDSFIFDGQLFISYGYSSSSPNDKIGVVVFDIRSNTLLGRIDLTGIYSTEPEGLDLSGESLAMSYTNGTLYVISLES